MGEGSPQDMEIKMMFRNAVDKIIRMWAGPGINVRHSKSGPTGAQYPRSLFMKNDETDRMFNSREQRKKILKKLKGE